MYRNNSAGDEWFIWHKGRIHWKRQRLDLDLLLGQLNKARHHRSGHFFKGVWIYKTIATNYQGCQNWLRMIIKPNSNLWVINIVFIPNNFKSPFQTLILLVQDTGVLLLTSFCHLLYVFETRYSQENYRNQDFRHWNTTVTTWVLHTVVTSNNK